MSKVSVRKIHTAWDARKAKRADDARQAAKHAAPVVSVDELEARRHPAIGQLMRQGKPVFYATIGGKHVESATALKLQRMLQGPTVSPLSYAVRCQMQTVDGQVVNSIWFRNRAAADTWLSMIPADKRGRHCATAPLETSQGLIWRVEALA